MLNDLLHTEAAHFWIGVASANCIPLVVPDSQQRDPLRSSVEQERPFALVLRQQAKPKLLEACFEAGQDEIGPREGPTGSFVTALLSPPFSAHERSIAH
ncbi:MAG: hypothetical protein F4X53_15775 [Acidimicrobiales bacterium]|nr:hypothetical protein [Acidimicrobiales bacterium]